MADGNKTNSLASCSSAVRNLMGQGQEVRLGRRPREQSSQNIWGLLGCLGRWLRGGQWHLRPGVEGSL